MVPERVSGRVHQEQAAMRELQLHRVQPALPPFPPCVPVAEDEIPRRSQRYRRVGGVRILFLLIVLVLAHVFASIFIPVGAEVGNGTGQGCSILVLD